MIGYAAELPGAIGWRRGSYQPPARRMIPPIVFTRHAIDRYIERVRPTLEPGPARQELNTLVQRGDLADAAPEWEKKERPDTSYFCPTDGVCFPLCFSGGVFVAVTCITRDGDEGAWYR